MPRWSRAERGRTPRGRWRGGDGSWCFLTSGVGWGNGFGGVVDLDGGSVRSAVVELGRVGLLGGIAERNARRGIVGRGLSPAFRYGTAADGREQDNGPSAPQ